MNIEYEVKELIEFVTEQHMDEACVVDMDAVLEDFARRVILGNAFERAIAGPQSTVSETVPAWNEATIFEAVARGWGSPENSGKEFDRELGEAIAKEVIAALKNAAPQGVPSLSTPSREAGESAPSPAVAACAARTETALPIHWYTPEDADRLLRPLLDESGAVDECVVMLDRDGEGFDGGPTLRAAWYDGARGYFVCTATARTLHEVTAWAYGKERDNG